VNRELALDGGTSASCTKIVMAGTYTDEQFLPPPTQDCGNG